MNEANQGDLVRHAENEEDDIFRKLDIRRYILALVRGWRVVALVTLLFLIIGIVAALSVRGRTFKATAVLLRVEPQKGVVLGEGAHFQLSELSLDTLIATVKLPSNLQKVIEQLKLDDDIYDLGGKITLDRSNNSNLINLSAVGDSPAEAVSVANAVSEIFIEQRNENRREEIRRSIKELDELIKTADEKFAAASDEVAQFSKEHGIIMLDVETEQNLQKIADLKAQIEDARVELSMANRQMSSFGSGSDSISETVGAQKMAELQSQLDNLRTRYTDENPQIAKLQNEIAAIRNSFAKEQKGRLMSESSGLASKIASLESQRKELQDRLKNLTENQKGYAAVRQKLILAKQMLQNLMIRREEANALLKSENGEFRLLEKAVPAKYYGAGIPLAGFIIAVLILLLAEFLNSTVKSAREIFRRYGLHTLGQHLHDPEAPADMPHIDTGVYRPLVSTLTVDKTLEGRRIIGLYSTTGGSGQTTVCENLALALAGRGQKVLVVDLNICDRNGIHLDIFSVARGEYEAHDLIVKGGDGRPDRFFAGMSDPSQFDFFASEKIREILHELSRSYDLLLVDIPPAFEYAQTIELLSALDAAIIVVRAGRTQKDHLERVVRLFSQGRERLLGVFISDAEPFLARRHEIAMADSYRKIEIGRDCVERFFLKKLMS